MPVCVCDVWSVNLLDLEMKQTIVFSKFVKKKDYTKRGTYSLCHNKLNAWWTQQKFLTEPLILRGYNLHDHVFKQLIIVIPCMSDTLLVIRPLVFYGHLLTSTTVPLSHYKHILLYSRLLELMKISSPGSSKKYTRNVLIDRATSSI